MASPHQHSSTKTGRRSGGSVTPNDTWALVQGPAPDEGVWMRRSIRAALSVTVAASLTLAGCSTGSDTPAAAPFPTGNVTITMSGWSLSTTPEFKTLADGFHALHP